MDDANVPADSAAGGAASHCGLHPWPGDPRPFAGVFQENFSGTAITLGI